MLKLTAILLIHYTNDVKHTANIVMEYCLEHGRMQWLQLTEHIESLLPVSYYQPGGPGRRFYLGFFNQRQGGRG